MRRSGRVLAGRPRHRPDPHSAGAWLGTCSGFAAMSVMLRERRALSGPAGGGLTGTRVLARWAWRLLHREWRQQLLIVALLALTVAAAAFSVATAYNVASLPGPQFGSAEYLLQFAGPDQGTIAADVAAAKKAFGTIQVIDHQFVTIPGSTQTAEYRALAPNGPF